MMRLPVRAEIVLKRATAQVACEGEDGLLRVHLVSETCDVCTDVVWEPETVKRQVADFNVLCDTIRELREQIVTLEQERDAAQAWAREASTEERHLRNRVTALSHVVRRLLDRLEHVHADPRYIAVWQCAQTHFGPYEGPQYHTEMETAREVLNEEPR